MNSCFQNLMNYETYFCVYSLWCVVYCYEFWGWLSFDQIRMFTRGLGSLFYDEVIYLIFIPDHCNVVTCLLWWVWSVHCYCFPVSLVYNLKWMIWFFWYKLWIFDQLSLDCFPVACLGLRWLFWFVLGDVIWYHGSIYVYLILDQSY